MYISPIWSSPGVWSLHKISQGVLRLRKSNISIHNCMRRTMVIHTCMYAFIHIHLECRTRAKTTTLHAFSVARQLFHLPCLVGRTSRSLPFRRDPNTLRLLCPCTPHARSFGIRRRESFSMIPNASLFGFVVRQTPQTHPLEALIRQRIVQNTGCLACTLLWTRIPQCFFLLYSLPLLERTRVDDTASARFHKGPPPKGR